ncbi:MAG: hypothetical protein HYT72_05150 [Candidatus Aenigmarchaeota archaeon]|nr:hypothetical protein [Candidatus Aenigmarchaeota archaeon]
MEKPLFSIKDKSCEHREVSYELRPRGGAWSSIYDADAVQMVVRACKLTGTECISRYRFDCPRYSNAILMKQRAEGG